jgi:hypothetical protein
MGEGANRLIALPPVTDREREAPEERAREIVGEIEDIRNQLDRSLSELDRRRHEATDLRLQIRRHPAIAAGVALGILAAASGVVALAVIARRRERPASKARSLRRALGRAYENPHELAQPEPGLAAKVLGAVATTVVTALAKKYIDQLWRRPRPPPAAAPAPSAAPVPSAASAPPAGHGLTD